jgi:hypothetical protein
MPAPTPPALDAALRSRIARVAVGPSTVRGNPAGTAAAARRFLRRLRLQAFGARSRRDYQRALDGATRRLEAALPDGRWGVARKVLNIYLRDCVYSAHLREAYGLARIEPFRELPLDAITAGKLRQCAGGHALPRWAGVRGVTPALSAAYQAVAITEAGARGIAPIHLDAIWWSEERDD